MQPRAFIFLRVIPIFPEALSKSKLKVRLVIAATQKVQKDLDGFTGALALTKSKQDEINKLKAELDKASNTIKDLEAKLKDMPKKN